MKKFLILILCLGWVSLSATSWRVNNNVAINADFANFADAVAGSNAGDTLYIEGSLTSYGTQAFAKQLVLIGPGYFLDQNDSTQITNLMATFESLAIDPGADGSQIYGFNIDVSAAISANYVVFARNNVSAHGYSKIILAKMGGITNCVVSQNICTVLGTSDNFKPALNTLICNNIVSDIACNLYSSLIILNNVVKSSVSVNYSVIKNNIHYDANGTGFIQNTGNVFEYNFTAEVTAPYGTANITGILPENVFVDYNGTLGYSTDGKWQLKEGSPAIGAGDGGIDCGAFGEPTPYVLSGLPAVPHIFEAIVPTAGSNQSGLPVTIKVKAQN